MRKAIKIIACIVGLVALVAAVGNSLDIAQAQVLRNIAEFLFFRSLCSYVAQL